MKFTIYTADCTGNAKNTLYPNQRVITCEGDLKKSITADHVCAQYQNNTRSDANFIVSDVFLDTTLFLFLYLNCFTTFPLLFMALIPK